MNCTELYTAIQDTCLNTETSFNSHLNEFIKAAEDEVFLALEGPLFYKTDTTVVTVSGQNEYTNLVAGTIDVLSVRLCETVGGAQDNISTGGPFRYLLRKDIDFLYEAYPGNTATGLETGIPKYYAVTGASVTSNDPTAAIRLGPTPGAAYKTEIEYYGKSDSDSITTGSTVAAPLTTETWLSVAFPHILVWGAVVQAYIYMKGNEESMLRYETKFKDGVLELKNMTEKRQKTDMYSNQPATAPGESA